MAVVVPLAQPVVIPFDDQQLRRLASPLPLVQPTSVNRTLGHVTTLTVPWSEVLLSTVLVGVPDWQARRRHGRFGDIEIWRRLYFALSHLDLRSSGTEVGIHRTAVFDAEDGSEKTASSYTVGMTTALLVARATGTARALLHFDGRHGGGGIRPDLVAAHEPDTDFYEAKGRYRAVRQTAMDDAVQQLDKHWMRSATRYAAATATGFVGDRLVAHRQHWTQTRPTRTPARPTRRPSPPDLMAAAAEPLVTSLWNTAANDPDDIVRFRYDQVDLVCAHNRRMNLLVGVDVGLFAATTAALADDGINLRAANSPDPREQPRIDVEAVSRDGYVRDGVYVGWDNDADYEPIPGAPSS